MDLIKRIFLLILAICFSQNVYAKTSELEKLMQQHRKHQNFNGSVLIGKDSEVLFDNGFGSANVSESIANTPRTRFNIASITKQFTAAVILLLVEEKKLALDDTINHYLPYYRSDIATKVTIHQLLNHTSGFKSYGANKSFMQNEASQEVDTEQFILNHGSQDLAHKPGSEFLYSNSGYYVLGAIIEVVTNMNYADAVHHYVFQPLNMKNSGFDKNMGATHEKHQYAIGYHQHGTELTPAPVVHNSVSYASGGLYSTTEDLFKWNIALHTGQLLPADLLTLMMTPSIQNYGYGIRQHVIELSNGTKVTFYGHGGSLFGFNNYLAYIPQSKHSIAVLSNTDKPSINVARSIIKTLLDIPITPPTSTIADQLIPLIVVGKSELAAVRYSELLENNYPALSESTLVKAGKRLFSAGQYEPAESIFTFNAMLFPNHCRSSEWIGKTHLAKKQFDKAVLYFKKAVAISDHCDDAVRFLVLVEKQSEQTNAPMKPIPEQNFGQYVGVYQMSKSRTLKVLLENQKLYAQPQGQRRVVLKSLGKATFKVVGTPAKLKFIANEAGEIGAVKLLQRGKSVVGNKME